MAYPEKRDGKLTDRWIGEVDRRHKGGIRFRRYFDRKAVAEAYEDWVPRLGKSLSCISQNSI
jgi:hypothetical protein